MMSVQAVLDFWFSPDQQPLWFVKSAAFDEKVREQFADTHRRATLGELWSWRQDAQGRLAEIIVLDQFSRNLFREQPASFAQDGTAIVLAQEVISLKLDQQLDPVQRKFLYMPFMHSESLYLHEVALKLFQHLGDEQSLDYEKKHQVIIERFGRYPHRNEILGRTSTLEEIEFLKQPNSSF